MSSVSAKGYVTGSDMFKFIYPALGDDKPPVNAKVLLLTSGGVCVIGPWRDGCDLIGWVPLPKRDKTKERMFLLPL